MNGQKFQSSQSIDDK